MEPAALVKGLCLGVTGSRFTLPYEQLMGLKAVLDLIHPEYIRHGDCTGADIMAHTDALSRGIKCIVHPPILTKYRAFAQDYHEILPVNDYLTRNRDIVDASDVLVALPKTGMEEAGGTWYTVRYARKRGLPIYIVYPDGTISHENPKGVVSNA